MAQSWTFLLSRSIVSVCQQLGQAALLRGSGLLGVASSCECWGAVPVV